MGRQRWVKWAETRPVETIAVTYWVIAIPITVWLGYGMWDNSFFWPWAVSAVAVLAVPIIFAVGIRILGGLDNE